MTDREILEKLLEMLPKEREGAIAPFVKEIRKRGNAESMSDALVVTVQETEQSDVLGEYCFRFYDDGLELTAMRYKQIPAQG